MFTTINMSWLGQSQNRRRNQTQTVNWFLLGVVVSQLILSTCSQSTADPSNKGKSIILICFNLFHKKN